MKPDPIIDEIRRVRHEMSAEFGHDPRRAFEFFQDLQRREKRPVVNYGKKHLLHQGK